ncbi:MAG: hypothetical protein ACK4MU_01395, partial [Thermomonas sp.]
MDESSDPGNGVAFFVVSPTPTPTPTPTPMPMPMPMVMPALTPMPMPMRCRCRRGQGRADPWSAALALASHLRVKWAMFQQGLRRDENSLTIPLLLRGGAVWQLVGLITRRSQVQILPP